MNRMRRWFKKGIKPSAPIRQEGDAEAIGYRLTKNWIEHLPTASQAFDKEAFLDITEELMIALTPHAVAGRTEEMRTALIKIIAVTTSRPVLYGTDEDVFALSQALRGDYYSEVMRLRRAASQDISEINNR